MAKDYAKSKGKSKSYSKRRPSSSASGPLWLLVGLLIGLAIAGIVYLKQHVTVSIHPTHSMESINTATQKAKPAVVKQKPTKPVPEKSEDKLHFDFYTILPKMQVDTAQNQQKSPRSNEAANAAAQSVQDARKLQAAEQQMLAVGQQTVSSAPSTPAAMDNLKKFPANSANIEQALPTPVIQEPIPEGKQQASNKPVTYILQIAAVRRFEDADQLQAKLALLGFEAKIKQVNNASGVWQRVWLGPYSSLQAAKNVKIELQTNKINSTIVSQ